MKLFRVLSVLLLVCVMSGIFYLSSQNADESSNTSVGFTEKIIGIVYPKFEDMPEQEKTEFAESIQFPIRKSAHFAVFFLLGFSAFCSLVTYKKMPFALRCAFALIFGILYSVSDEYHQTFVSGRSGELRDIIIDSVAVLVAVTVCAVVASNKKFSRFIR